MTRNHAKLGLETPPLSPTVAKEITLRGHLQEVLDKLPQDLPTYHHEELLGKHQQHTSCIYLTLALDGLCFLLHSPLFYYAVSPRIRREEQKARSSETNAATTQTPIVKNAHEGVIREPATYLALSKLCIDIKQEENGWVTRLLYNNAILIEGRDLCKEEDSSFITSFRFFCEEVEFLSSEFRSRERAGAILRGAVSEQDPFGEEETAYSQAEGKSQNTAW
ncbi:hypothetical protein COCMIDRAFT_90539 [Bipolaris oryzae ATCC 44560]|uniref:Uncharacterized protein n=1 Tax=Bipolaris oryzae ATCC 44560 TaxID=930090 RepID=W6ZIR4_COCMI|nr:uncharacterized protein COCMIDRAFT_90539 [Bipolaris oryzae ATCC 44560]EUC47294.1 hypothetical protein COCMIDRAFT_90539 [Bipolaris oryzae ATCC 44560]